MERKGIHTVKGDTNCEIKSINAKISALLKRIDVLDNELAMTMLILCVAKMK